MFTRYSFILVVLLLGAAAALLTDRSKLPLPLRGLKKALGTADGGTKARRGAAHEVPAWRRWLAFALVLAALMIAAI